MDRTANRKPGFALRFPSEARSRKIILANLSRFGSLRIARDFIRHIATGSSERSRW